MGKFKFTEKPGIYVVLLMFSLLLALTNAIFFKNKSFELTVTSLIILVVVSYIIHASFKTKLRINTIKRNTGRALGIALIMISIIFVFSTIVGIVLGYANTFMEANSIAMLGSIPRFILEQHKIITFIVFFGLIPIPESIIAVDIVDLMLVASKSTYKLKDPKVWIASAIVGGGAVVYHYGAKFIPFTGELNIHALFIVWALFFLTCIFAIKTREMEGVIYGHMGNNAIAMYPLLKGAFNFIPK